MWIASALLLSVFSVIAQAQGLEGPVTLFLSSDRAAPAPVLSALQTEAETIALGSLIRLSWQAGPVSNRPEVYTRLAVVRLHGECRPDAPIPSAVRFAKADGKALGQTQTVNGEVLPIVDVQCDSVRQFLDRELRATPAEERDEVLGRALGRIVAHELYHVLLRTRSHGKTGLARPLISRAELLAPRQSFAPADEQRIAEGAAADTYAEVGAR